MSTRLQVGAYVIHSCLATVCTITGLTGVDCLRSPIVPRFAACKNCLSIAWLHMNPPHYCQMYHCTRSPPGQAKFARREQGGVFQKGPRVRPKSI
ncbi:unnamed protein product [Protopolystoma xenopodis]|uniref:Secreted protein n=1 Tax=Protopolystoma xenopodis TaxID=117903 RepID=A0A3S5CHS1_9PLAT|nr:unnamed protein product [Protopolystoma xenopodis]